MRTAVTGDPEVVVARNRTGPFIELLSAGDATFTVNAPEAAVTVVDDVAVSPPLSFTVPFTVYVPPLLYGCDAVGPVAIVPSPKSIVELTIVPSESVEAAVDAVTT